MDRNKVKAFLLQNGLFYTIGILVAVGIKYHCSGASSEDLHWILAPTVRLVEILGGIHFEREWNVGFISHVHRMIIGPPCAGVTFLVIAFSTLFFSFTYRFRANREKFLWLGISLVIAYFLALGVNAIRIMIAIHLNETDIYGQWMTPARVHRIEGTLLYFFFLIMVYLAGERIATCLTLRGSQPRTGSATKLHTHREGLPGNGEVIKDTTGHLRAKRKGLLQTACSCSVPFFWYALFTLGIPALNKSYNRNGARFMEHCFLVISVCFILFALFFFVLLVYHKTVDWLERRRVTV